MKTINAKKIYTDAAAVCQKLLDNEIPVEQAEIQLKTLKIMNKALKNEIRYQKYMALSPPTKPGKDLDARP